MPSTNSTKASTPVKEKAKDEGTSSSSGKKRQKTIPDEPDLVDTPESSAKEKTKSFGRLKSGSAKKMELDQEDDAVPSTPSSARKKGGGTTATASAKSPTKIPSSSKKDKKEEQEHDKAPLKTEATQGQVGGKEETKSVQSSPSGVKKSTKSPSPTKKPSSSSSASNLPFDGKKFVLTGSFGDKSREAVEEMVLCYGGKVSKAISGNTNYCLAGTGETMNGLAVTEGTKYKTAVQKGIKILGMPEFQEIIDMHEKNNPAPSPPIAALPVRSKQPVVAPTVNCSFKKYDDSGNPITTSATTSSISKSSFNNYASTMGPSGHVGEAPPCKGDANGYIETSMWVDKYKPSKIEDVIGANDIVGKLQNWLQKWHAVHIKKSIKIPFAKENPGAKAVLISGPPGIGKIQDTFSYWFG